MRRRHKPTVAQLAAVSAMFGRRRGVDVRERSQGDAVDAPRETARRRLEDMLGERERLRGLAEPWE